MENDRPPVLGMVGRIFGQIRLTVCDDTKQQTIEAMPPCAIQKKEWARDDDGDGVREVHCNTMEGI